MASGYDLVIRNGSVIDGSGRDPVVCDVAIAGKTIVEVGHVSERGTEEIDATGLLVTPGFVDIHTHYDGQVTWDDRTAPSANHGVTTVMMGNCGVGFAPCRPEDRTGLIHLMEGVEDIPEVVMATGLLWNWETFPDYLDVVASRARDIDCAALLPHSCLRVYVMGPRALDHEAATSADLEKMTELTCEAMKAGALGFGTSRLHFHRSSEGKTVPTKYVDETELRAIARGMSQANSGILQAVLDMQDPAEFEGELSLLRRVSEATGRPTTFTLVQLLDGTDCWRRGLDMATRFNRSGPRFTPQVFVRPVMLLYGLNLSTNPFSLHPTYRKLHHLPLAEKVAQLKRPEVRAAILAEEPVAAASDQSLLFYVRSFDRMFAMGDPPNYEPSLENSVGAQARRRDVAPEEIIYDILLENDGNGLLMLTVANYADGNLDAVSTMIKHENTVVALGDGGAHYGMICDASYPTFMLAYWTRDRKTGERIPLKDAVRLLSLDPARTVGLNDRGLIAAGYKADINVIDYDRLQLFAPRAAFDLPAGGRRLSQQASGYVATIVSGKTIYREGVPTGALPGRLVRGPQVSPPEFAGANGRL